MSADIRPDERQFKDNHQLSGEMSEDSRFLNAYLPPLAWGRGHNILAPNCLDHPQWNCNGFWFLQCISLRSDLGKFQHSQIVVESVVLMS